MNYYLFTLTPFYFNTAFLAYFMLTIPSFAFMISGKFAPTTVTGIYIRHIISFQLDYNI